MPKPGILIVDNDPDCREILQDSLGMEGYAISTARNGEEALAKIAQENPDLVLLDIRMPRLDGMEVLRRVKEQTPERLVIMITAYGTIDIAVEAMKLGAYDFVTKPLNPDHVAMVVTKALERKSLVEESRYLRKEVERSIQELKREHKFEEIVGNSPKIREVIEQVAKVAPTDATVLIQGETGAGKEFFAKVVHDLSPRRNWPFVVVDCGAIPDSLMESELFGHEKGSFTGAYALQRGKFELADRGTVFLDEVGEVPLSLQTKLFRALESGVVERIGGKKPIKTNVRIIAATCRNLAKEVEEKRFRMELYYRLNVVSLTLPPLRERGSDVELLSDYFLREFVKKYEKAIDGFRPEAKAAIREYDWPGNVRELEHRIERAVIMTDQKYISAMDLEIDQEVMKPSALKEAKTEIEVLMVKQTLVRNRGNISRSAGELGVTRKTLRSLMTKYGLKRSDFLKPKVE